MFIDLTHTIHNDMPYYPGTKSAEVYDLFRVEQHGFSEKELRFLAHTGTHIDAPAHMIDGGKTLDEYEISDLVGNAYIIDLKNDTKAEQIIDEIKNNCKNIDFIIFRTGWSILWGKAEYFENFPVPSIQTIDLLCSIGIKAVGIDTASVDPVSSMDYVNHLKLLGKNVLIIENLKGLERIKDKNFVLTACPVKVEKSDGCPARVFVSIKTEQILRLI